MKILTPTKLMSAAAAKLLRALSVAVDSGLPMAGTGGCQAGKVLIPAALVEELIAKDWLAKRGCRLHISGLGMRALERLDAVKGKDGFDLQNRIIQRCKRRVPGQVVDINLAESPLGWLKRRALIDERQWLAGERLRADFYLGQQPARTTMSWDALPMGKTARGPAEHLDPTLAQINAKKRFGGAMGAAGPGLSDVLWRVVCVGEGLETAEKAMGWPARAGKLVLTLGLDRVAGYYRI
jgi:Domain of unknown function (DUF6456)